MFIDETATKMTRLRGRCLKGQRLRSKAPFGHWKTQTFIAGLRCHGLTAPFVVDMPMNRRIFETYVETQLAPTLAKGDVVILDNLAASHKYENAYKLPSRPDPSAPQQGPALSVINVSSGTPLNAHFCRNQDLRLTATMSAFGKMGAWP